MDGFFNNDYYPSGDYKLFFINQGIPFLDDHRFINIPGKGLSNSRNFALKKLNEVATYGDIVILTDNDISFDEGFDEFLRKSFHLNSVDVLTFKVKSESGEPFKSNYMDKSFFHSMFSLMKVSSVEYSFKYSKFFDYINFDNKFGLGSEYPIGEENIFLTDLKKAGCTLKYIPEFLCVHNDDTHTGQCFTSILTKYRFSVFKRIFGSKVAIFIFFFYLVKNRRRLDGSFFEHLRVMF